MSLSGFGQKNHFKYKAIQKADLAGSAHGKDFPNLLGNCGSAGSLHNEAK